MPIVTIKLLEGRSREQKTALMREVTAAVVNSLGVAPPAVRVLLEEVSPEHWSVGGISKAEPVSGGGVTPPTGDVR
ncbi:2-hydroxymuconate tautomerase family protein [Rhizobium rhizogenes]|nr:4-oxalocrotonate tautomerase family enzyme [Rhizobium sp. AP16]NTI24478.1 2-hydroxymuconate tautomerase family protein [Rhizobium rhizogenes]OCJ18933.1 4-oxalocrotonate tautomerase [Agrobacterium sp. B131/95]NTI43798.1 2-hydroxymuconate tautomerase family protein [Rhizobium rhizogenes]NTI63773.1 2-hydroxymuconate tautomerase family protein [Rhizobium rhizogenes]